jgi:cytidine deaminase
MTLREVALKYAQASYSPYSKAQVGSAVETEDGTIFGGCNIENSSFGGTVCAERVAIWKAVSEGHKRIRRVYVYTVEGWPPCGLCRQVMSEFATDDLELIISNKEGQEIRKTFKELMPMAFTPEHLIK